MPKRRGHGEGAVFRAGRYWAAELFLGYGPDGKKRVLRWYGKTRAEVQEKLHRALAERQAGLLVDPENVSVEQFLTRWLEDSVRLSTRPRTYECYALNVRKHIVPALGKLPLRKLAPVHLQQLYARKLEEGLSPRTVQLIHTILHRALGQAAKWGLVPRNGADLVDRPKAARKEMRTLTAEQVRTLLKAAKEDRLYALYVLAVTTGMRQGELLGLRWEDVDLERSRLHVRCQLSWPAGQGPRLVEPKSATGRRTIELPPLAVAALKEHRRRQAEERLRAGSEWRNEWGLVFTTVLGTPIHPANLVHYSFYRLLAKAGLPRIRFHDLRHTCATLLLEAGEHPKVVQEMLGHSSIQLTLDTYSHVTPALRRQAAERMQQLLAE